MEDSLKGNGQLISCLFGLEDEKEIAKKKEEIICKFFEQLTPPPLVESDAVIDYTSFSTKLGTFEEEFLSEEDYYLKNTESFYQQGELFEVFLNLANLLEELLAENIYLYHLDPQRIYLAENKLFFNWNKFDELTAKKAKMVDSKLIEDDIFAVKKVVRAGNIARSDLKVELINHTFIYLFFKAVMPQEIKVNSTEDLKTYIDYLNLINKKLPLKLKGLLSEVLLSEKGGYTPMKILKKITSIFKRSAVKEAEYKKLEIKTAAYAQKGFKKKRLEDHFFHISVGESAFLMVADGISTADIGNGRKASAAILDYLESKNEVIKEKLLELNQLNENYQKWQKSSHDLLEKLFNGSQKKLVKRLNEEISEVGIEKDIKDIKYLMSSTLNLAILTGNWLSIAWIGDSPAYLYSDNRLIDLLEPHTEKGTAVRKVLKDKNKKINFAKQGGKITRWLPNVKYEEKEKKFKAKPLNKGIDYKDLFLNDNDIVLLGSDGIIDCLTGTTEDEQKDRLLKLLKTGVNDELEEVKLAYKLSKTAAEDNGFDNITVVLARVEEKKENKGGD